MSEVVVTVESIGHRGDGIVHIDGRKIYLPLTTAGDVVRLRLEADEVEISERLSDGPGRAAPACIHFGDCGGCQLQHLAASEYAQWKRARIVDTLAQRGIAADVHDPFLVPQGARRRATFAFERRPEGVVLGFHRRASEALVDVERCPVTAPSLIAALPALRKGLDACLPKGAKGTLNITATDSGLAAAMSLLQPRTSRSELLRRLGSLASIPELAQLTLDGEIAVMNRIPTVQIAGSTVKLPPGAFLQASKEAERFMATEICAALAGSAPIVDLFSGLGTFSLGLLAQAPVHAVDSDDLLLQAQLEGARRMPGQKPLTIEKRNLFRRPLTAQDLHKFGAAVFDPPRAGAHAQAETMAASQLARIAAVSCDPATFARDARILIDGGYRLDHVSPVDQFLWSSQIELVALFIRGG